MRRCVPSGFSPARGWVASGPMNPIVSRIAAFVVTTVSLFAPDARALESFTFTPGKAYDRAVPTPESLLGRPLGEMFTPHETLVRAVTAISGASDRVRLLEYGRTWAGRPLLLAVVSSAENIANLSRIQDDLARLADPRRLADGPERRALIDRLPVVVWLSFNVHGNEPSPSEAGLGALYHFAACQDDDVKSTLDHALIVMDPCVNPDGRERYVQWLKSVMGARPNPDPRAAEHDEPWPGGRSNHYYFDLNRDWAFQTQVETRARIAQYRRFRPQVHVDYHEMFPESSYFFFPAALPVNANLPASVVRWGEEFGKGNAAAFDRFGWGYYTAEAFDLFYPGYGDSWPTFNGAIGMTYEQGGHGLAGTAYRRHDGSVLTLRDRASHHFTTALSTVGTAVTHRVELLSHYARFFDDGMWEGANGPVKEFLLVPGADHGPVEDLIQLLLRQGIEVSRATEPFSGAGSHAYSDASTAKAIERRFPAGTYVVSLAQPMARLAKALLEPNAAVKDAMFYDVSAWSLPLAFGVEAFWVESAPTHALEPVESAPVRRGSLVAPTSAAAPIAWLVRWDSFDAPRFLDRALRTGLAVRTASRAFRVEDQDFPAGTLVVPVSANSDDLRSRLEVLADATRVTVVGVATGRSERGPDLGSDTIDAMFAPAIAVATGEGTDSTSVGAVRHLFDHVLEVPFTLVPLESLARAELGAYDVLVLPDGFGYSRSLGKEAPALKQFCDRGGVVIAIGGAAAALCAEQTGFTGVKTRDEKEPEDESDKAWAPMRERRIREQDRVVPGTLCKVRLDPDHPLAFGVGNEAFVLIDSTRAFLTDGPGSRLGVFEKGGFKSGFISDENLHKLEGKAVIAEVSAGRGRVILFGTDPNFRSFLRGQSGLFLNAVYRFVRPPARAG